MLFNVSIRRLTPVCCTVTDRSNDEGGNPALIDELFHLVLSLVCGVIVS
ncbi:MAG: hypothetical protein HC795_03205 [Coleofasciculaceae cyanobacterium RL_1_1]|nr:hypothetical protein [Coleofasciculaceae cyanobacterium RL_1_1]